MITSPQKNIDIDFKSQILLGSDAVEFLTKDVVIKNWIFLMDNCPFSSVFQDSSFVLTWYQENLEKFSPVVLVSFYGENIIGLMTLARKIDTIIGKSCQKLFGAGDFFALYQSWLVLPEFQDLFFEKGIKLIFEKFPGCSINLKYIPNINLYLSLSNNTGLKKMVVLEKHLNPVLDFKLDGYDKIFGKRHFKSKLNRLNRAGKVSFEKINSLEKLEATLDSIEVYHNLRQGAAFNKIPFDGNKNQRKLFLKWFESGILHITALHLDGILIAAVITINDFSITAHLAGLITYSPQHAKLSPGLVHLFLLSQSLKEESFQNLKLSPGNDAYKERFSNANEELYELLISPSWHERLIRKLRVKLRQYFLKKGIRPMEVHVWFSKKDAVLKNRLYKFLHPFDYKNHSKESLLSKLKEEANKSTTLSEIKLNSKGIGDLQLAGDTSFEICRWRFLEDALRRFENKENCLTLVSDGELRLCMWYIGELKDIGDIDKLNDLNKLTKIYVSRQFVL
jgi:hypothetical protein